MTQATLVDDFSPRAVGDVSPLEYQFADHSNNVYNLTGLDTSDFVLKLRNTSSGATKTGKGSWAFVNAGDEAAGICWYTWHADDVKDAGVFEMQVTVPLAAGPKPFEIKVIEFIAVL